MTLPGFRSFKELAVVRAFIRLFAKGSLAPSAAEMIDDLMFENSNKPGSLGTPPFKLFVSLQRCEKSLLYGVFRGVIVAHSKDRILEKIVAVIVQPTTRIR